MSTPTMISSSLPPTPSASVTLKEYEDTAQEFTPLSRTASVQTQVAPEEVQGEKTQESLTETEPEKECETDSEDTESDDEPLKQKKDAERQEAVRMASMVLFGGVLLAGLAYYLSNPVTIHDPYNSRDFF